MRTDHGSLSWLFRFKAPEGQLAHWLEVMSQYDFQIQHRPGVCYVNANALSCQEMDGNYCDCYDIGQKVEDLPCRGCDHCRRAHESWKQFVEDVDDVVPLVVRTVGVSKEEWMRTDSLGSENGVQNDTSGRWLQMRSLSELRDLHMNDPQQREVHWWDPKDVPSQKQMTNTSPLL